MTPRAANLTAKIDRVEDGAIRIHLRGGHGNPIVETWRIFKAGPLTGFHAERYGRAGDLVAQNHGFQGAADALSWLTNEAWAAHAPESITVYPARVARVLKGGL